MKRNSPLFLSLNLILLIIYLPAFSQEPEDITIERNDVVLKGKFHKAANDDIKPVVILLQGSPGNTIDVLGLGKLLSMSGINAMTFNYSGSHQSTGTFSFPNCQADIEATLQFLHRPGIIRKFRIDTSAIILAGYSFGGGMATAYAIRHKEIKRLISIAGVDWGIYFDQYRTLI
jgi:dienelactone hydrolase